MASVGKAVCKLQWIWLGLPRCNAVQQKNVGKNLLQLKTSERCCLQPSRRQWSRFLTTESSSLLPDVDQLKGGDAATVGGDTKQKTTATGEIAFASVDADNVQQLRELNATLFPVQYGKEFYEYAAKAPEGYCKLACTEDGAAIGAVCCEVEPIKLRGKQFWKMCILTLGVRDDCRRSRIGSLLLKSVLAQAVEDELVYAYLEVHCSNTAAQKFYNAHDFEIIKLKRNYYSQLKPPHAFLLRKSLR